jgi:hypothetical protein
MLSELDTLLGFVSNYKWYDAQVRCPGLGLRPCELRNGAKALDQNVAGDSARTSRPATLSLVVCVKMVRVVVDYNGGHISHLANVEARIRASVTSISRYHSRSVQAMRCKSRRSAKMYRIDFRDCALGS